MRNSINQISFDMKKKEENKNSKNSINQKSLVSCIFNNNDNEINENEDK